MGSGSVRVNYWFMGSINICLLHWGNLMVLTNSTRSLEEGGFSLEIPGIQREHEAIVVLLLLHKQGINHSIHAGLIQDVQMIMTMLGNVCLVKNTREQTRVAYKLAQHAGRICNSVVWLGSVLRCIEHVVLIECYVT